MYFAAAIGPIRTGEGAAWIAIASAPNGALSSRIAGSRDAALSELAATLPSEAAVTCDPALSQVAAGLGWTSGPLPHELLEAVAVLAVGMMHGPLLRKLKDPSVLVELLTAAAGYALAQPWERFGADEPLELKVSGATSGSWWAMSFGALHQQAGLALYETRAAFDRFIELTHGERPEQSLEVDALSCLVSFEPGAVTDAVHRACDVAFEPHFFLMKARKPQPLRTDDARLLTAALRAVASVGSSGAVGTGVCELFGKRVEARVEVAAPEVPAAGRGVPASGPQPNAGHRLDAPVLPLLLSLARTLPGWSGAHLASGVEDLSLLSVLSLFVRPHEGKTIAARFLETQPPKDQWAWVEAHQRGWLSLFEVEACGPGEVALHDLLLDRPVVIYDVGLSRTARPHDVLVLWLVEHEGVTLAGANKDAPLGLGEALSVREQFCAAPPPGGLTRYLMGTAEHCDALLSAVKANELPRGGPQGELTNTDKDPIHFGADHYSWAADAGALREILASQPDAFADDEDKFTLTKLGNALHPSWRRTVLASVELSGQRLTVKANSTRRLDAVRQWLARIAGERLTFRERTSDASQLPPMSGSFDIQPLAEGPWMELVPILELRSTWLSPTGTGLHATDARAREETRRQAHVAIAHHERDVGPIHGLDLRRAIGLSWRGEWIAADSVWLGMGAGIPMSLALQTVAAPILGELEGDQRTGFCDGLRLAWAAWAVAGLRVSPDEAALLARGHLEPGRGKPKSREPSLSPALPRSSPNVEIVLAATPWAIDRVRLLFPLDRRVVMEVRVNQAKGMLNCQAMWTADVALEQTLKRYGYRAGLLPLQRYADLTLGGTFEWQVTPPAWRRELVADFLRTSSGGFGTDFRGEVEARVAVEDALLEREDAVLRAACRRLEDLSLEHVAAVGLLAQATRTDPALVLSKKGAAFEAALDRLIAEATRRFAGRH